MAIKSATDTYVTIAGNVVSQFCNSVDFSQLKDQLDATTFGANFKTSLPGLKSWEIMIDMFQDYTLLDAILAPLYDNNTLFQVEIRSGSGARSVDNPGYVATNSYILEYGNMVGGEVGTLIKPKIKIVAGPASVLSRLIA